MPNNSYRNYRLPAESLGFTIEEFNQKHLCGSHDPKRTEKLIKATKDFYSSHNLGYDYYAKAYQEVLALCLYPSEVRQAISRLEQPYQYELEIMSYQRIIELCVNTGQLNDIYQDLLRLDDSNLLVFHRKKWNEYFAKETPLFKSLSSVEKHLDNHLLNKAVTSSLSKQWYQLQLILPKDGNSVDTNPFFQKQLYHDQIAELYQGLMVESNFYHAYNTFATSRVQVRKEERHIYLQIDNLFMKEVNNLKTIDDYDNFIKNDVVQSYLFLRPGIKLKLQEIEADLRVNELIKSNDLTLLKNSLLLTPFKQRFLIERRIKQLTNH